MEGQYMHFVGDLTHLAGQPYEQSICSLGIMGTRYIRDTNPITSLDLTTGTSTSFIVERIRSEFTIGNDLDINLR